MPDKSYIAIDLKSFYASVECVERGLDPLTTNPTQFTSDKTRLKTIQFASMTANLISASLTHVLRMAGIRAVIMETHHQ